jgi:hypothetical protein
MDIKNQIRQALGLSKAIKLEAEGKLADGTLIVSDTAFEAGANVMILTEDGSTLPLPVGEYEMEDGTSFSVTEEGVIAEIYEEEAEEAEEEVEAAEEEAEEAEASVEEVVEEAVAVIEDNTAAVAEAINEATPEEVTPEIAEIAAEAAIAVLVPAVEEEVALSKEMKMVLSIIKKELDTIKGKNRKPVQKKFRKSKPDGKPVQSKKFSSKKNKIKNEISEGAYKMLTTRERYLHNLTK